MRTIITAQFSRASYQAHLLGHQLRFRCRLPMMVVAEGGNAVYNFINEFLPEDAQGSLGSFYLSAVGFEPGTSGADTAWADPHWDDSGSVLVDVRAQALDVTFDDDEDDDPDEDGGPIYDEEEEEDEADEVEDARPPEVLDRLRPCLALCVPEQANARDITFNVNDQVIAMGDQAALAIADGSSQAEELWYNRADRSIAISGGFRVECAEAIRAWVAGRPAGSNATGHPRTWVHERVEALRGAFAVGRTMAPADVEAALDLMSAWTGLDLVCLWRTVTDQGLENREAVWVRTGADEVAGLPMDLSDFLFELVPASAVQPSTLTLQGLGQRVRLVGQTALRRLRSNPSEYVGVGPRGLARQDVRTRPRQTGANTATVAPSPTAVELGYRGAARRCQARPAPELDTALALLSGRTGLNLCALWSSVDGRGPSNLMCVIHRGDGAWSCVPPALTQFLFGLNDMGTGAPVEAARALARVEPSQLPPTIQAYPYTHVRDRHWTIQRVARNRNA